ncbi:MAG: SAM-dependent methyltransferase [Wenzhouxiangellaceae bacterium]
MTAWLREQMAVSGALSYAEFMEACLYHPQLGYYTAPGTVFGAAGDFTTAPEIGDLFAYALARHIAAMDELPRPLSLLEVGAGSGRLAQALIRSLQALEVPLQQYFIVERSPVLRRRQQELLAAGDSKAPAIMKWVEQAPAGFQGLMIANEVLDALTVERVRRESQGWVRLGVEWRQDQFNWCSLPLTAPLERALDRLEEELAEPLSEGYTSEIHLAIDDWLAPYAQALQCGAMLMIDYGYPRHEYYHPQRSQGTLICHYRHQVSEQLLRWPGIQDLTAFVDFTRLAEAADKHGLDVMGYTSQAQFLLNSGVLDALASIEDPLQQAQLAGQARQLMLPGEMGERFQVMLLGRGIAQAGPGFAVDMRHRL